MKRLSRNAVLAALLICLAGISYAGDLNTIREAAFPAKSGELLWVGVHGGDIIIKSWDKEEVEVVIKGNTKAEKRMSFDIEKTDDGVRVEAKKEGSFWNWFSSIQLKVYVHVPAKYELKLKTSGGDIDVADVTGNAKLSTSGGDISFRKGEGEANMSTSGGDIVVEEFKGPVKLSTSGGDIRYKGTDSDVIASTSGGDIMIKTTNGKVKGETSGGDIKLIFDGENKGIYLSTSGGDIVADLGSDVDGYVEAKTSGGDVESNNSNLKADHIKSGLLKGSLNAGGESITLKTSGGDVRIN